MAQSTPEHAPGLQTNYHYLTFGWLVEGLVQSVTGGSLRDFVKTNIAVELNLQSEFMIGIGSGNTAEQQHADRLPAVSANEREVADRVANLVLGRIVMPPRPAVVASDVATTAAAATTTAAAAASANADAAASATATPTAAAATATATTSNTVASTTAAAPHAPVETEVETKAEVVVKVDHSLNQKSVTVQGNKIHVRSCQHILTQIYPSLTSSCTQRLSTFITLIIFISTHHLQSPSPRFLFIILHSFQFRLSNQNHLKKGPHPVPPSLQIPPSSTTQESGKRRRTVWYRSIDE
jgi:hypothetical protein